LVVAIWFFHSFLFQKSFSGQRVRYRQAVRVLKTGRFAGWRYDGVYTPKRALVNNEKALLPACREGLFLANCLGWFADHLCWAISGPTTEYNGPSLIPPTWERFLDGSLREPINLSATQVKQPDVQ
jgi:hypothetical protein